MNTLTLITPAVFTTEEAEAYCKAKLWEALINLYGEGSRLKLLVPIRRTKRGDSLWLRSKIDEVLAIAQAEGALLIHPDGIAGDD